MLLICLYLINLTVPLGLKLSSGFSPSPYIDIACLLIWLKDSLRGGTKSPCPLCLRVLCVSVSALRTGLCIHTFNLASLPVCESGPNSCMP